MTHPGLSVVVVASCAVACVAPAEPDHSSPPLTGGADVERWLADGWYRSWHCERVSTVGDGHGSNRVCSNDLVMRAGPGEFPIDAAQVKEMWSADDRTIIGYAVSRHTRPGTTGDTWYWYERVPTDSALPHDPDGVAADGWGDYENVRARCVTCHAQAGRDGHSGHDFIYTVAP